MHYRLTYSIVTDVLPEPLSDTRRPAPRGPRCRTLLAPKIKPNHFAALNYTKPARGKSQAI
jgi:hypothetical protein